MCFIENLLLLFGRNPYRCEAERERLFMQQHTGIVYHLRILAHIGHLVYARLLQVDVEIDGREGFGRGCFGRGNFGRSMSAGAEGSCRRYLDALALSIGLAPTAHIAMVAPRLIRLVWALRLGGIKLVQAHKLRSLAVGIVFFGATTEILALAHTLGHLQRHAIA